MFIRSLNADIPLERGARPGAPVNEKYRDRYIDAVPGVRIAPTTLSAEDRDAMKLVDSRHTHNYEMYMTPGDLNLHITPSNGPDDGILSKLDDSDIVALPPEIFGSFIYAYKNLGYSDIKMGSLIHDTLFKDKYRYLFINLMDRYTVEKILASYFSDARADPSLLGIPFKALDPADVSINNNNILFRREGESHEN